MKKELNFGHFCMAGYISQERLTNAKVIIIFLKSIIPHVYNNKDLYFLFTLYFSYQFQTGTQAIEKTLSVTLSAITVE